MATSVANLQPQQLITPSQLHDLAQIRSTNEKEYQLKCLRFDFHIKFGKFHLDLLDKLVKKQQVLDAKHVELFYLQESYVQVANALTAVDKVSKLQSEITQLEREIDSERTELCLRQEAIKQQNPHKFQQ